jgi:hypothetical protein
LAVEGIAASEVNGSTGSAVEGIAASEVNGSTGSAVEGIAASEVDGSTGSAVEGIAASEVDGSTGSAVEGIAPSEVAGSTGLAVEGIAASEVAEESEAVTVMDVGCTSLVGPVCEAEGGDAALLDSDVTRAVDLPVTDRVGPKVPELGRSPEGKAVGGCEP